MEREEALYNEEDKREDDKCDKSEHNDNFDNNDNDDNNESIVDMADNSEESSNQLVLSFDYSTQQLKCVAVSRDLGTIVASAETHYDTELPEFRTLHGVISVKEKMSVCPASLWVKATDLTMEKLVLAGVNLGEVVAISGCAQQHGSVYWRNNSRKVLRNLDASKFLHEQLSNAFAINDSPTWMDASTFNYCKKLESKVPNLREITGSKAELRFTGPQIAKICNERAESYDICERISLISNFACSLFLNDFAPIDLADASGMNLLHLAEKSWHEPCLKACAPDLRCRLGEAVPSGTILGPLGSYFVDRFGFGECDVIAFTGDNPSSLAGMQLGEHDLGVSLGTSDTLFMWHREQPEAHMGHVFVNPVDSDAYMSLLCYKNGSLTRERKCREAAEGCWSIFAQLLDSTPRGNFGNLGIFMDEEESTPRMAEGDFRVNRSDVFVDRFNSKEAEVRALIEGQFMAKRIHADKLGFKAVEGSRLMVCGGASANKAILQVLSDVFNMPVYSSPNGHLLAALGSAFRAIHSLKGGERSLSIRDLKLESPFEKVCSPNKDAQSVYKPLLARYEALEQRLVERQQKN